MNIETAVGNTPMVNIGRIYAKLEYLNPSGSIKDRAVKAILSNAEAKGLLTRGMTLVECSSGNTGVSMAMLGAKKNYGTICIVPKTTSIVKIKLMQLYGCGIIYVKNMKEGLELLNKSFSDKEKYYRLHQFEDIYNVHGQENMAIEAYIQMHPHLPDAVVAGMGTGGTLRALDNVFRVLNPSIKLFTVRAGQRGIEGICDGIDLHLSPTYEPKEVEVSHSTAVCSAKVLAKNYGINAGLSSGANFYVAKIVARRYKRVLTVFPDNAMRYLNELSS